MLKKAGLILFLVMVFFQVSCEREDTGEFVERAEVASEYLRVEMDALRLFALFHKVIHDTALMNRDTAFIDSALVTMVHDTVTGLRQYTIDFGSGQAGPDWKIRSGKIQASLNGDFDMPSSTFAADLDQYMFEDFEAGGEIVYMNTGETNDENPVFYLNVSLVYYQNNAQTTTLETEKNVLWTEGADEPENWQAHQFLISGDSYSEYINTAVVNSREAEMEVSFTEDMVVVLLCPTLVKSAEIIIQLNYKQLTKPVTGTFIDSDIDNCVDKVMLKNSQNFGFPFYL